VKLLLDHCVPAPLVQHIPGHAVSTVRKQGWEAFDDGALLDAMAGRFDVLITLDSSIPYQQMIAGRPVAVAILRAKSNRVGDVARLAPALLRALGQIRSGEVLDIT
jgi:predicted nuclease of predicted toxin-antitoxin system